MGKTPVQVCKCIQEMKLIHLVAKILGLAPFSIQTDRDTNQDIVNVKLTTNISRIALSLVVLTTIISGFVYGIIQPAFTIKSDPGDILCTVVSIPIHYTSTLFMVTLTPTVNRYKIEELMHKLVWIDEHFARLRRRSAYGRKKKSIELYLPILALTVLFMCYDSFLWSQCVGLIFCITVRFSHIIALVAKIQCCKTVMMIRNRLSGVEEVLSLTLPEKSSPNKQLPTLSGGQRKYTNKVYCLTSNILQVASAEVLNDPLTLSMITADTKPLTFHDTYTILNLRRIYNHIYECSKIINSIFGFYILLEILRNLTSLTSALYSVVRLFNEPIETVTDSQFSDFLFSRLLWIIILLGTTTCLTVICGVTASKSKDIAHKIQTLLLEDSQKSDVVEQLKLFSQQMSTDRVVFTAAGFFVIDISVLCAFLTSVTTYIIVLIQFKSR
jgi:gustatory receptor